jgi:hypothetical protein
MSRPSTFSSPAGDAEQIRAVLAALAEDADQWPVRVATRMPRAGLDLLRRYAVEVEDHLDVREAVEPVQRLRPEALAVQLDHRLDTSPVVVLHGYAAAHHVADWQYSDLRHRSGSSWLS